eukprot:TRINITY_DN7052_c0_g2_i1.p1 TRINITY_DN7052_c0_g2~~TRINITY_DN7052_c0_g2_i1.p1  ORF type:complete len:190 (+),score=37.52 TRINITY_DN7052_c0_g2_i1:471-1040(+)
MGSGDLEFNPTAYFAGTLSCLTQTSFLLMIKKTSIEREMTTVGLLYYNSLIALPILIFFFFFFRGLDSVLAYPNWADTSFLVCLFLSLSLGLLLNFAMFLCTIVNSPLDLTVAGQFKALGQTLLGLVLLGGMKLTVLNSIGLTLNTLGGVWYSAIKYYEGKEREKEKEKEKYDNSEKMPDSGPIRPCQI